MNNKDQSDNNFFTPSGCLTAEALERQARGLLHDEQVDAHLASCELCSDSLEGVKMWLSQELINTPLFSLTHHETLTTSNLKLSHFHGFSEKVTGLNTRIHERIEEHRHRRTSTKPKILTYVQVWIIAAACLVLFLGIYYVFMLQPDLREKTMAVKQAEKEMNPESPISDSSEINNTIHQNKGLTGVTGTKELSKPGSSPQVLQFTAPIINNDLDVSDLASPGYENSITQEEEASKQAEITINREAIADSITQLPDKGRVAGIVSGKMEKKLAQGEVEESAVFSVVEEVPSFPGGEQALKKFLSDNIQYPLLAKENGIQGTVYASFLVDKNGRIGNIKIIRGIGGGCDEEALRVLKKMPDWIPGKQNGKSVRVLFNLPIYFILK
jgi:TonB family protein